VFFIHSKLLSIGKKVRLGFELPILLESEDEEILQNSKETCKSLLIKFFYRKGQKIEKGLHVRSCFSHNFSNHMIPESLKKSNKRKAIETSKMRSL